MFVINDNISSNKKIGIGIEIYIFKQSVKSCMSQILTEIYSPLEDATKDGSNI